MSKIYGFHHICLDKNGKNIFEDQFNKIKSSGLYDATETIYCCVLGERNNYVFPEKYKIIHEEVKGNAYERPILQFMHNYSKNVDGKFWYIHTKGISHYGKPTYANVEDWRKYMEFFIITRWKRCILDLDNYDIAGVNYASNPSHFSGNFWWARATYIRNNKPQFKGVDYYETEMWLPKGNPPPIGISYHTSNTMHYVSPYPISKYEPESKRQLPLIFTPGLSEANCNSSYNNNLLNYENYEPIAKWNH